MSSASRFFAAAAAALVVSLGATGFLAARRSHSREVVASPIVSAAPAPIAAPSPQPSPVAESEVVLSSSPADSAGALLSKTPAPKPTAPAIRKTRTTKSAPARHSESARPAPSPAVQPVVEAAAPPPPTTTPTVDPAPALPPGTVVETTPVEIPKPRFEEHTVNADTVVGIRIDQSLSSETAKVEDRVTALVSRDVTVDGRTALPAGTRLEGNVMLVQPGSKFKGRARLGIRFHTIVLSGGLRVPIQTEALYRDGESATKSTATRVGTGAAAGAILGAVLGGKRGALIGAGVGAGGGTAAVMAGDAKEAVLPSGTPLTMRLTGPVTLTIERDPSNR